MVYLRGATPTTLEALLGARIRSAVFARIFDDRLGTPWLREVYRSAHSASGARRELDRLVRIGLVRIRRAGGAAFFDVVETHPLAAPLRDLARACAQLDELHRTSDGLRNRATTVL